MIRWVKGANPGKASVKRINCTCMFTSANYQLIRSNCTDSNVHGNEKSVPSTRVEVNVIKNHLLAKNSKNFDQKRYLI
jgi:hypothetical protein